MSIYFVRRRITSSNAQRLSVAITENMRPHAVAPAIQYRNSSGKSPETLDPGLASVKEVVRESELTHEVVLPVLSTQLLDSVATPMPIIAAKETIG